MCTICVRQVSKIRELEQRETGGKGGPTLDRMVHYERLIFVRRSEGGEGLSHGKAGRGSVNAKAQR